jgi:hypothetical protein
MQSQPPPKGSLEELFRHHLLESEAAAVPPRPLVWEHIDNSLLLAQNEKYRRRLLVHRWGMAASLLLATLAGGGWWHSQQVATTTMAANTTAQREAMRQAVAGAVAPNARHAGATSSDAATLATNGTQARRGPGTATAGNTALMSGNQVALATAGSSLIAYDGTNRRAKNRPFATASSPEQAAYSGSANTLAYEATTRPTPGARQTTSEARTSTFSSPNADAIAGTSTSPFAGASDASFATSQLSTGAAAGQQALVSAENVMVASPATRGLGEDMLAGRLATLALAAPAGPPTDLVAKALPPVSTELRHWRYGAEYAISAFQPNIDFNRGSGSYNQALGSNTISLTRAAAAEYRANLRPGLGQRLTLRATRWLGGHWSLSTGLEVAQKTAYSATSAAFTGEQLADASSFNSTAPSTSPGTSYAPRELHESSFRYRSAGIPIELQYDNQAKNGVSFYGRIGAIVSALLSAHSEVAGNSEATRTYTAFSASSPYRRLTALLRGSAGVRYRPAGRTWGLNVGPTAEAGVQSLNAETDRSFLQQSRPYSVGIEAGFEFGGTLKPVPATN